MAWDESTWLPPRSEGEPAEEDRTATAFDTTDVHGYFELGRRIRNTAILLAAVAAPPIVFVIGLRVLA